MMGCGKSRVSIEENNTTQLINNYNKNNDVMVNKPARFLVNDGNNHVIISPISNEIMKNVYEPKTLYFAFQKCKSWGNVDWCTVVKKSEEEKLIQKMGIAIFHTKYLWLVPDKFIYYRIFDLSVRYPVFVFLMVV